MKTILLIFILFTHASGQQYTIDFDGEKNIGHKGKVKYEIELIDSTSVYANDSLVNKVHHQKLIKTSGLIENLKSTNNGKEIEYKYVVDYFNVDNATDKINLFPKGTEINFGINDKNEMIYKVKNKSLSEKEIEILSKVFEIRDPKMPSENELFGPQKPVSVGESWEIDSAKYVATFEKDGSVDISNLEITGVFKLDALERFNDKQCLKVVGAIKIEGIYPAEPLQFSEISSNTTYNYIVFLPVDKPNRRLSDSFTINISQIAKGKVTENGKEYLVEGVNTIIQRTKRIFSY
ncbi:MAG: hypothetical protein HYZ10_07470 [Ignavibacteriales bacterium]|nr:hypothetical protein [Ignavibacteriales bacterium]